MIVDKQEESWYNDGVRQKASANDRGTEATPMKYYSYSRVSTATQAEKGGGLESQRQTIERYCIDHDIEIERAFIDAGISGAIKDDDDDTAISKRAGLIDLLGTLEDGDTVIVANTSRLWRSDSAKVLIRRELMKKHIKVISVENEKFDLYAVDPTDRLLDGIQELLDEWERLSIALKLSKGRAAKARNGAKPAGVCPLGYKYSEDKKSVVVDDVNARTVKKMFTMGQQGYTLSQIADAINRTGARTQRGQEFSKGTVAKILNNRFYIGELTHAGQTIKGTHTPLISKQQFGRVQAALERRKRG